MEAITWSIQTSLPDVTPVIISEYLLNDLGIYVKREKRVTKKAPFTALTGFRVGYKAVPGTDYRSAPLDRNVLLWYKITSVVEEGHDGLIIRGNRNNEISIKFSLGDRNSILHYIETQRRQHPVMAAADFTAASWICWQEDDDWGDPHASLADMVEDEKDTERFIEPEVLEATELTSVPENVQAVGGVSIYCTECGVANDPDSLFCEQCGTPMRE